MLGRRIDERLLAAVTDTSADEVDRALEAAVAAHVLEVDGAGCRFRHDLVREAIYDDLLPGQRQRLHGLAARAIEEHPTLIDPPEQRWALLAHHWDVVGDADRALDASVRAGRWALSMGCPGRGGGPLRGGPQPLGPRAVLPEGTDLFEVTADAAEARLVAGQPRRAIELAEAALAAADPAVGSSVAGPADPVRLAQAHQLLGRCWTAEGDMGAAGAAYEASVAVLADQPATGPKVLALARFAGYLMVMQRCRQALAIADQAIAEAAALGDRRVEGHARCTKGVVLGDMGRIDDGLDELHRSVAMASEVGHQPDLARAYQDLTYVQLFAGMAGEAMADAERGLALVRPQGAMLSAGIGIVEHQAEAAVRLGRFDDALRMLDDFPFEDLEGITVCSFAAPRVDVLVRRGQLDDAAAALAPALERAAGVDDAQFGGNTRIRAAELALATGDLDVARALASTPPWRGAIRWTTSCTPRRPAGSASRSRLRPWPTRFEPVGPAWARSARTGNGPMRWWHGSTDSSSSSPTWAASCWPIRRPSPPWPGPSTPRSTGPRSPSGGPRSWPPANACGDRYWGAAARLRQADATVVAKGDRAEAGLEPRPTPWSWPASCRPHRWWRPSSCSDDGPDWLAPVRPAATRPSPSRRTRPLASPPASAQVLALVAEGLLQLPDRRRPLHQRQDRQRPRLQPAAQARGRVANLEAAEVARRQPAPAERAELLTWAGNGAADMGREEAGRGWGPGPWTGPT